MVGSPTNHGRLPQRRLYPHRFRRPAGRLRQLRSDTGAGTIAGPPTSKLRDHQEAIMHHRSLTAPRSVWAARRLRTCCALAALPLGVTAALGQPPDRPEDRDPLFQPVTVDPANFAALTLGGGCNPSVGAFQCVDMLIAGEHPWIAVWSFYEPTLTPRENTSVAASALAGLGVGGKTAPLGELALLLGGEKGGCSQLNYPAQGRPSPRSLLKFISDV